MSEQKFQISLLYFANIREKIGIGEEKITIPPNVKTIDDLIDHLCTKDTNYENAFSERDSLRVAIDQIHADHSTFIQNAREIAFFPPMTGG